MVNTPEHRARFLCAEMELAFPVNMNELRKLRFEQEDIVEADFARELKSLVYDRPELALRESRTGGYHHGNEWHQFGCECPRCLR